MFCKECGNKINSGDSSCTACGGLVFVPTQVNHTTKTETKKINQKPIILPWEPVQEEFFDEETEENNTNGKDVTLKQILIVIGCTALAVALFFGGKVIYTAYENQQQQIEALTQQQAINSNVGTAPVTTSAIPSPSYISDASGNLLPSAIAQIEPNIVEINCYAYDSSIESSGSGISYTNSTYVNAVETNYHVYTGAVVNGQAPNCFAVFPEPPNFSYNGYYGDYQLTLSAWNYNPNTYEDMAIFTLGNLLSSSTPLDPIPVIEDADKNLGIPKNEAQCLASDVNVGDGVTIFGYPNSGNLLGISETVTTGIISGILAGPIYKTNAAIDHGNSGGVAILNKNGCALGIPTLGASGLTSGIGYIQSYSLARTAIFASGCTSYTGYSSTTGLSCSGN